MIPNVNEARAIGLRDVFLAQNAREMEAACRAFMDEKQLPPSGSGEWEEIEFAYNRLFVGPGRVIAPPYASVYLESEAYLMGETTRLVRNLYHTVGLESPWEGVLPDDHISLELDACLLMHQTFDQSGYSPLIPLFDYFINRHLGQWIPEFVKRILETPDLPNLLYHLCTQLEQWLHEECEWLGITMIRNPQSLFLNEEKHL